MCFTLTKYREEGYPIGMAYEITYGKWRETISNFMDAYQSMIYLMMIIGTIGAALKKEKAISFLWPLIFLGGFFFSVIWEAKARYIYPYFVMLIPISAYGVWFCQSILMHTEIPKISPHSIVNYLYPQESFRHTILFTIPV